MENTTTATSSNETAQQIKAETRDDKAETAAANEPAEQKCENGVCKVIWKPKRSAA